MNSLMKDLKASILLEALKEIEKNAASPRRYVGSTFPHLVRQVPGPNMNVEPTMTDDEHETDVCIARLAALFSQCRATPNLAHCWNFTKHECDYCKAPFPYP